MTLSHRDVQAVGEFLTQCYSARDVDGYAERVLSGVSKLVPSVHSSFNLFDQQRQRITWVEHPHEADRFPGAEEVLSAHFHEHPAVRHFLAHPADPAFVKVSDFMTDREFASKTPGGLKGRMTLRRDLVKIDTTGDWAMLR